MVVGCPEHFCAAPFWLLDLDFWFFRHQFSPLDRVAGYLIRTIEKRHGGFCSEYSDPEPSSITGNGSRSSSEKQRYTVSEVSL